MVEVTLAAAMQLRTMLRAAGVMGAPGVRIRQGGPERPGGFELTVEERMEPGDEVNEARGIRFYVDDRTASVLGDVVLDLEGREFVLRPAGGGPTSPPGPLRPDR